MNLSITLVEFYSTSYRKHENLYPTSSKAYYIKSEQTEHILFSKAINQKWDIQGLAF